MNTLFGAEIQLAPQLTWELAHELQMEGGGLSQWRIHAGLPVNLTWTLHVFTPARAATAPHILLSPDGCWPQCVNPAAMQACAEHGVSLAWFNRLEFAHDPPTELRQGSFYDRFPESETGCLSVWAWSISLTAQALRALMPTARIGVIGHSRGGKAALLCAARDSKIDAVISNNSGTGGAASLVVAGEGAESLHQLASTYPHWLSRKAGDPVVQLRLREIDCMSAWASIAPRPVLILQAVDDVWANPVGTQFAHTTLETYSPNASLCKLVERDGGHAMQAADWHQAAQFMLAIHVSGVDG
jgi:hypothetical protein